jgi:hypothetical protein
MSPSRAGNGPRSIHSLVAGRGALTLRGVVSAILLVLCVAVFISLIAVVLRLAYDAVTSPPPKGDALKPIWAFLAAAATAAVALTGVFFTRAQSARTEERLALDTAVNGLKLLMTEDGTRYAVPGVVAGAVATLVHLKHPVIAMRALAACWEDNAVDAPSATWLISEIFELHAHPAQLEAAAMLDAHAHELCREAAGSFSWPASIEFRWIPNAPLPARLRVLRAVLRTLVSKEPGWWRQGGRQGWAFALFHHALQTDKNNDIKAHAASALACLVPLLRSSGLTLIQSLDDWISIRDIEEDVTNAPAKTRDIVMLRQSLRDLEYWALGTKPT